MKTEKVELNVKPFAPESKIDHSHIKPIRFSLPYYRANFFHRKTHVHKVKSVYAHWEGGNLSHLSISFVCGNLGSSTKGRLLADPGKPVNRCKQCFKD